MKTVEQERQHYEKWLSSLKVGDEICYRVGFGNRVEIAKVIKITPSKTIVTQSYKFRSNGKRIGQCGYHGPYQCEEVTQKIRDEMERFRNTCTIQAFNDFRKLTNKELHVIAKVYQAAKKRTCDGDDESEQENGTP